MLSGLLSCYVVMFQQSECVLGALKALGNADEDIDPTRRWPVSGELMRSARVSGLTQEDAG